jgi:hypothetical protein
MSRLNRFVLTIAATASLSLIAAPAMANQTINIDGTNPSGGAYWVIDEYGIASGVDAYETTTELYYPNYVYVNGNDPLCDDNYGDDAIVTEESNGDVTVDCPVQHDTVATGIDSTMHFRFFAESDSGYLAREWIEIQNTTGSEITLDEAPKVVYYWNYYGWVDGDHWMTSQDNDYGTDGDTWGAGAPFGGNDMATTSAWAAGCTTQQISAISGSYVYGGDAATIPAGANVNIVNYFNMYFPTAATEQGGADSFDVVQSQAAEFDQFDGRLIAGLPTDRTYLGWTDGSCPVALAETGSSVDVNEWLAIAFAAAAAGVGAIVLRRRQAFTK